MGIGLDGLGGFPTGALIDQLMKLEAQRSQPMVQRKTQVEKQTKALQDLNSKFSTLAKDAYALMGKKDKFSVAHPEKAWLTAGGKSSHPSVEIKVNEGAQIGKVDFKVVQTAKAQQLVLSGNELDNFSAKVGNYPPALSVMVGNTITTIKPATGSAQDMAKAINDARDLGVTATAVRTGDGHYVLQITGRLDSKQSGDIKLIAGDANKLLSSKGLESEKDDKTGTVTYKDGRALEAAVAAMGDKVAKAEEKQKAQPAIISMWGNDNGEGATEITSPTNTFKDLMPGVDVTIGKDATDKDGKPVATTGIQVSAGVERDPKAVTEKVEKMVTSFNDILNTFADGMRPTDAKRADGTTWKAPGVLTSSSLSRQLRNEMRSLISEGVNVAADGEAEHYVSLSEIGIKIGGSLGEELTLSLDKDKFAKALEENPAFAQDVMTKFAEKVANLAQRASDPTDGDLTLSIKSRESEKDRLNKDLEAFQDRMEQRRADMEKQFATLQTMLQQTQAQGAWLQSQLAQLPRGMM